VAAVVVAACSRRHLYFRWLCRHRHWADRHRVEAERTGEVASAEEMCVQGTRLPSRRYHRRHDQAVVVNLLRRHPIRNHLAPPAPVGRTPEILRRWTRLDRPQSPYNDLIFATQRTARGRTPARALQKSQVLEIAGVWKDITVDTQKETLERIPLLTIAWVLVILLQIADQISLKLLLDADRSCRSALSDFLRI
jgi:hypothetical protein